MVRSVLCYLPWVLSDKKALSAVAVYDIWTNRLYSESSPTAAWLREQVKKEARK